VSKQRVAIVFGGRSTEHEVSITSATTILQALDPARYTPLLIGIDHEGQWHVAEAESRLLPETVFTSTAAVKMFPTLGSGLVLSDPRGQQGTLNLPIDVIFPIVHGRGGEDGILQGVFEAAGTPYVGTGVSATALCMDKTLSKRVLRDAGLPVLPSHEIAAHRLEDRVEAFITTIERDFEYPVFIKPSNTGSSVGVSKAMSPEQLRDGIRDAARYDSNVLVEPGLNAREIECAVLGGHRPEGSVLGEIISANEFYDYEAKYVSDDTQLLIPAELSAERSDQIRSLAVTAFKVLKCWGMARVDFFLDQASDQVFINELNTHPGFTDGSMYPRMWEASGIALPELIDRLIELALERHQEQGALEVRFRS
jgi:D-alanine-D-alanine ligase